VPLNHFLETELPGLPHARGVRRRQRLATALGEYVARLHAAVVFHHDLHPGNLLVRWSADDRPDLALIDLHAVSVRARCRWDDCRRNLVVFNRYFALRASRPDRRRFWEAYCQALGAVVPRPVGQTMRELEAATGASNRAFWRARDRRCLASNRYYRRVRGASTSGYAVRDLDGELLRSLLADPDAAIRREDIRVLKTSPSSTVIALDHPSGGSPGQVVLKRFHVRSGSAPWVGMLRPTAALRSWAFGHGLRERCLPTARPLAVVHRYRAGTPREGYLLTERIVGATELHDWLRHLAGLGSRQRTAALRSRIDCIARLVRDLHERGLTHRDLKAANFLTPLDPADHRAWFIDLVGVRRPARVTRGRRVQNLSRLSASFVDHALVSRSEKLRFLATYLNWGLQGKAGWKGWWREIAAATQAKVTRNARRGRPLA
jgi:tRNA A-37 threonylcarbamoyl transferase component Bud32